MAPSKDIPNYTVKKYVENGVNCGFCACFILASGISVSGGVC